MTKPNGYVCNQCPDWDDVNGCWQDCKEFCGREFDVDGEEINQEYEQHLEDTDIRQ